MIYQLTNPIEQQQFKTKTQALLDKGAIVELKEKRYKRTYKQNAYLHLILSWFAIEYGDTLGYVKQYLFKQHVNPQLFKTTHTNPKTHKTRTHWRSTTELNTEQLSTAIERFRNYSAKEFGCYLPSPNEQEFLAHIHLQIEKNKHHL